MRGRREGGKYMMAVLKHGSRRREAPRGSKCVHPVFFCFITLAFDLIDLADNKIPPRASLFFVCFFTQSV